MGERRRPWRDVVRWLFALLFALLVSRRVDLRSLGSRLAHLDAGFVALFLALSVPLYLLCAWRWHFTAARLGARIPFRRALLEYYLSTLLNQIMPVGVAGDVVRAARHHRRLAADGSRASWRPPASAVILERLSGVVALAIFVVASGAFWVVRERRAALVVAATLVALVVVALVAARLGRRSPRIMHLVSGVRAALFERGALLFQLSVSIAAVAMLLAMFASAGRAAGVPMSLSLVVQVVPLVLAVTTFPWAFAGLGPREAATAALFASMGLTASDGVLVSVTFGALSLLAATPGAVVLLLPRGDPA